MTKAQRRVIEEVIRKADRGPSMPFVSDSDEAERQARVWSESWIADPLRALLDNVDGKLSARELAQHV